MTFHIRDLVRDARGSSAVEFAIIAPMLLTLLLGIMCYGGYFWAAHSVQQLANDSARAAISGLDESERQDIANAALASEITHYPLLTPQSTTVQVDQASDVLAIKVAFDASGSFFYLFGGLVPMPPSTITRQAAVRLGGY